MCTNNKQPLSCVLITKNLYHGSRWRRTFILCTNDDEPLSCVQMKKNLYHMYKWRRTLIICTNDEEPLSYVQMMKILYHVYKWQRILSCVQMMKDLYYVYKWRRIFIICTNPCVFNFSIYYSMTLNEEAQILFIKLSFFFLLVQLLERSNCLIHLPINKDGIYMHVYILTISCLFLR